MFKLYNEDCLNVLRELPDESVDLIITSPPYNMKHKHNSTQEIIVEYNGYDDNRNQEEYEEWQVKILDECYRILKQTGLLYYNHKVKNKKLKQGFYYKYYYYDNNGKHKSFSSVDINKLKKKVLDNNLLWIKF